MKKRRTLAVWRAAIVAAVSLGLGASRPVTAVESGPQGIIRQYCQLDAFGARVGGREWPQMTRFIAWPLEPAWDEVVLISSYTIGSPARIRPGVLGVDVQYEVVSRVTAAGVDKRASTETIRFEVGSPTGEGWAILGSPPPPHLFAQHVNIDELRNWLREGTPRFVADSVLVWNLFRSAGWDLGFELTRSIAAATSFRRIDQPQAGDVVVYLRDQVPYHVGILDADESVVSSTLNLGVVRSTLSAFAGDVLFLRLVQSDKGQGPEDQGSEDQGREGEGPGR